MWQVGRGREPWERSEAGGVNDNERHLRHSRSRVPRRSSGRIKEERGQWTREDQAWTFSLCFVCGSCPWGAAALLLCLFMLLKYFECSPVPASFFPIYELCYIGAETREEGGTCCQKKPSLLRGSRCWGGRAARRIGDRQWLPEAVVLER